MATDALVFEANECDSVILDGGVQDVTASQGRRRAAALSHRTVYDPAFFLRVAHSNAMQTRLMNRSRITIAESLKLLAEISDLLRR